jgi:hypothetical protein
MELQVVPLISSRLPFLNFPGKHFLALGIGDGETKSIHAVDCQLWNRGKAGVNLAG